MDVYIGDGRTPVGLVERIGARQKMKVNGAHAYAVILRLIGPLIDSSIRLHLSLTAQFCVPYTSRQPADKNNLFYAWTN